MSKVITSASMSLDGFIAGPGNSGFEHLFAWHRNGDVEVASADPRWAFQVEAVSAIDHRHYPTFNGAHRYHRPLLLETSCATAASSTAAISARATTGRQAHSGKGVSFQPSKGGQFSGALDTGPGLPRVALTHSCDRRPCPPPPDGPSSPR
jgi:hypothetical protein